MRNFVIIISFLFLSACTKQSSVCSCYLRDTETLVHKFEYKEDRPTMIGAECVDYGIEQNKGKASQNDYIDCEPKLK